jgi:hypothetical protein
VFAAVSADDQRSAQFLALLILARGNRMKKGRLRRFPQVLPAETGTHLLVWVELDECRVNSTATFSSEH